jgi:acetate kinase
MFEKLVARAHDVDEVIHHGGAIAVIRSWLHEHYQGANLLAVGHRVVHGGQHFSDRNLRTSPGGHEGFDGAGGLASYL